MFALNVDVTAVSVDEITKQKTLMVYYFNQCLCLSVCVCLCVCGSPPGSDPPAGQWAGQPVPPTLLH